MIVRCTSNEWTMYGKDSLIKPIKGCLYEVVGEVKSDHTGQIKIYYILREIPGNFGWVSEKFEQVDIDISDATEKKITELPIEVLI